MVDAIMAGDDGVGEIYILKPDDINQPLCLSTLTHHLDLASIIAIGNRLFPKQTPEDIIIFAVGIREVTRVTGKMTDKVKEAIPKVVELIEKEICYLGIER